MAQDLLDALGHVIDVVDGLAHMGVAATARWWFHHAQPEVTAQMGPLPSGHTAHHSMAYATAKIRLAPAIHALSEPMAGVPSVAQAHFQWDLTVHKSGGVYKTKIAANGVDIATGGAPYVRKAVANLVGVLEKLPAHGGKLYLVGGMRLAAADPASALLLWAALHQKGAPTPQVTRDLLTGPKRPEILHLVAIDEELLDAVQQRL
jgi:hypothetical protein